MATEDKFAMGVNSMAHNCKAAIEGIRQGQMTLDAMDKWLDAVIANDPKLMAADTQDQLAQLGNPHKT